MEVLVKKTDSKAILPGRAHPNDAGADLFSLGEVKIPPRSSAKIRTGISIALPGNTAGFIWGKSSIESIGLKIMAGLVDEGYRGEVIVCVFNLTGGEIVLEAGRKIAQLVVAPVYYASFRESPSLPESHRGEGGFGSTGSSAETGAAAKK